MPVKILIADSGTGRPARVLPEGELLVGAYPSPPLLPQKNRVFRQYLTVDGLPASSNDMGINGALTSTEFSVRADEDADRYITALSFSMVCGTQPQFWEFADSNGALANGIRLFYQDTNGIEVDIHDAVKTNWDLIRLCMGLPTISAGAFDDAFIVRHVGAANDFGMIPVLHLTQLMPPFGIKLDLGTKQKLAIVIRDDCTDADTFDVIAYGFDRMQ